MDPAPKSNVAHVYKAIVGELPHTLNADDMVGGAVLATIENVDKTSKKGTAYTAMSPTRYS